ncbi:hypothetical protein V5799_019503 [Amblyomma americanum]|uniref:Lipocalin n=1 Tax=Amblyomma americanum TaxID=6943 RepID=A0AAQ4EWB6_AMBAM
MKFKYYLLCDAGGFDEGYEELLYQESDNSCGIMNITITMGEQGGIELTWFDLRVRNSSVRTGPTEKCRDLYKNYTKKQQPTAQIYYKMCQHMPQDKTDSTTPHYILNGRG